MARRFTGRRRKPKVARASVSFPTNVYEELEKLAAAKRVSLAWVVREAAANYVANEGPLLTKNEQDRD